MFGFKDFLETRKRGRSLPETGYKNSYAIIFRAASADESLLRGNNEYVTMSRKFAKEHADHQIAVYDEPFIAFRYMVKASDVYEASNPGEYFYGGPPVEGKPIRV